MQCDRTDLKSKYVNKLNSTVTLPDLFILFLIYLKLTTQAVHIYTNKIAILLKNS